MKKMKLIVILGLASALAADTMGNEASIAFHPSTGALAVTAGERMVWQSGAHGLWRLAFRDGTTLAAADFATNAVPGGTFTVMTESGATRLVWRSPQADVAVTAQPVQEGRGVDLRAVVTPKRGESLMLDFPARLDFPADAVHEFFYPGRGNDGLGFAFNAKFFQPSTPERPRGGASGFFSMKVAYPPLFADFAQLVTTHGDRVALYGLQPRGAHAPWRNPTPFTPGETQVGADAAGGWYVHAFAAYAKPGATVRTPAVRLRVGATLEAALADYATANGLTTPLAAKVRDAATLEKLKRAPLLKVSAPAARARKMLAACPVPTLYHPPGYLKGGFDKEYPDHLPPNAGYGTPEEMAALFRDLRAQGHLVSPYTNPTWWCDHPRGPSFVAAGEAPLAIGLNGKPYHEVYGRNDGWTTTFWHPAVQAANRETVRAFTQDYPVDLLFQDQCGARGWRWDFNPASPSPMAYTEGLLSMNAEDARLAPLGTEDGWDHTANYQTALCGCSWRIVPLDASLRPLFKTEIPADSWRLEPLALRLFHDKALFYMHDLGAFVTNERVLAWMLALGYNLSYVAVGDFVDTPQFAWYTWLHDLQARVVSRIAGQPLVAFHHDRAPLLARRDLASFADPRDDGVVTAQWGDVTVRVNLGDVPRTVGGRALAPYGWWIEGPGVVSGHLAGEEAFIETAEGRRCASARFPRCACERSSR